MGVYILLSRIPPRVFLSKLVTVTVEENVMIESTGAALAGVAS
jgi:hypothetical protein